MKQIIKNTHTQHTTPRMVSSAIGREGLECKLTDRHVDYHPHRQQHPGVRGPEGAVHTVFELWACEEVELMTVYQLGWFRPAINCPAIQSFGSFDVLQLMSWCVERRFRAVREQC